jgi:DNA-binding CsgD family transcriptional regulator
MSDLNFIEACYAHAPDESVWGAVLAERLAAIVPDATMVMGASYVVESGALRYLNIMGDARFAAQPSHAEHARSCAAALSTARHSPLLASGYARPQPQAGLISDLPRELAVVITNNLPWGKGDSLGCFGTLDGKRGYFLGPTHPDRLRFSRRRRQQLDRLSEHLAVGHWLQALRAAGHPLVDRAAAVCAPDGKVLHREAQAPELSERLVDAVRGMDRARCWRRKHTTGEATELWQALLVGQYTLVESMERNGRRLVLAVRCRTPRPSLTEREMAVAVSAARGFANKKIAAELGVATGTVGVHLAAALRKLGCPNRRVLAQWLGQARSSGVD